MKIIKRIFDVLFSLISILLSLPIILVCIVLIYAEDKSQPFYFQKRIGYKGKIFTMIKLRTMTEKKINIIHNKYYCFEDDPRITKVGKYLRKYSLDEIPQLLNVLIGDMSLVGPRPPIFDELEFEEIEPKNINILKERVLVRPGITGYAQVKSRNDLTWNQKLELDKIYLSYKPLTRICLDLIILMLTVYEIFSSKGIYDKKIF